MLYAFISIFGILLTIFIVIGIHESAHFFMARWLNVKVLCFSIGFGKKLFSWHDKCGTEYIVAAVPLGGYVRMLDEAEGDVPENEKPFAYNRQPFYKKFLIVMAGPLSNLISAFLFYWLIFVIGFATIKPIIGTVTPNSIADLAGLNANQQIVQIDNQDTPTWMEIIFQLLYHAGDQDQIKISVIQNHQTKEHLLDATHWQMDALTPDPLQSLGITPYEPEIPLVIAYINPKSPAIAAGLKPGDKIIAIDNTAIKNWLMIIETITKNPEKSLNFTIERNNKRIIIPVEVGYQRNLFFQKSGFLGIAPSISWPPNMLQKIQYGPLEAISKAYDKVYDFTYINLVLLGKMVTGKLSVQGLGGPITIFETAGGALNAGWLSFLSFLAFLSISIGVINFLPIPGLDGGHLFLQTIEAIIGKPIPEKIMIFLFRCGLFFILFVLIQALVNDLLRMF
ncbi:MAG: hypothetical protein ACD_46C00268G0007 [uncultured bacterium]|nr:MAG: hypothetical protein ACD_46C00268G0007 [uncultured bacterium]